MRRVDGRGARGAILVQVFLELLRPLFPTSEGRVRAEEYHAESTSDQANEGHDKGDSPCLGRSHALGSNKGVEDGWHDEVGDAAAGVAPSPRESIGCADNVLVEEAGAPDLAWDKRCSEDTNEESGDVEAVGRLDEGGEADR